MFSKNNKKYVFIDFGQSNFVKEDIGFKTWTNFVGNYKSSSAEMKKLYFLRTPHYIDLYYNDLFAMVSSLNIIKTRLELLKIETSDKELECSS
jgi:hypothetical protein